MHTAQLSLVFLLVTSLAGWSTPADELNSFAIHPSIFSSKVSKGKIELERVPISNSPLIMAVESCYTLPIPPEEAVELLKQTTRETSHPISTPAALSDFQTLRLPYDDRPSRWLINATQENSNELNLSRQERALLNPQSSPQEVETSWRQILLQRAGLFQGKGLVGSAPYDFTSTSFKNHPELTLALKEQLPIIRRFQSLLDVLMTGRHAANLPAPSYYWQLFPVSGDATLSLSAFFQENLPSGEIRSLENSFYVSSKYFTSLIFRDYWPMEIEGKPGTLAWRLDYVITPAMSRTKGIERMAAESILLLEIKKSVESFQERCEARRP